MSPLVVFREFYDGQCELGIMTLENGYLWVHVGDFHYCLNVNSFEYPFTSIGWL